MQTNLAPEYRSTPEGQEAEAILRKCVHCGFCTATCPTYQTLGDELDGPRGRIYLIKQVLEGATPTRATQEHLDRCLTCRNCESTCPSGVQYGHLVDIGRKVVDEKVPRPLGERLKRWALKEGIPSPLFAPAMKLGQAVRPLLPEVIKAKVPPKTEHGVWPTRAHARKVLLLAGCVQPAMLPNINYATARVLDAVGIQTVIADKAGCCGAVKFHLNDQDSARDQMRANIDAWWPAVEAGEVEAIISNASGCGAMVKDYAHALRDDSAYAAKAQRVSALARDLSELLPALLPELADKLAGRTKVPAQPMAYHPPCTLQHAQKLKGVVEANLGKLGFQLRTARTESHLCCGSAGTYSILQSDISQQLRTRKLDALDEAFEGGAPAAILSANIGCITHLQAGTAVPVRHWVEVLDEALV
ncbi:MULTISPECIES: glycolate oxidase subunit GlcF [Comamonas]|uniref:Glycolate oxidase iron-sulfur subunit n=1 Tax=Comamonas terrigena TaxID=32013 RepID=A0A2A7URC8_COMTR|nr:MULTISPECIES: glycolate oxidase subunit GlcF [Comamonas]MBD9532993.1 glycolate oxidase subunit GlcF [Comamonas sp. CMM01]PEH87823.1 glycolate oxidase iron-sulfur subunit [Comamonas terrigena]BBL22703.1 glycolate oxidase iron-sulfur subunit [Comamonas terrigena NBRC 13299]SUY92342.1 Anaerobic glycerol-3-phosphate dehydrogenase subunit C [Comamonas terrigena]